MQTIYYSWVGRENLAAESRHLKVWDSFSLDLDWTVLLITTIGIHLLKLSFFVQDIHSQGEVIACLEKGLVREDEEGVHGIRDDCKKAIMRVAELSSDDFHLDRYLYLACRDDRERFCENVRILTVTFT